MQEYCMKGESVMITERRFKNAVKAFYNISGFLANVKKWKNGLSEIIVAR